MKFFNKEEKPLQNFDQVAEYIKKLEEEIKGLKIEIDAVRENNKLSAKKIAISRYNPFTGVGGDQSFSLVVLDENNDGILVTSLFTQDGNRVYGKSVKNGTSEYQLSEEEKKILSKVLGK